MRRALLPTMGTAVVMTLLCSVVMGPRHLGLDLPPAAPATTPHGNGQIAVGTDRGIELVDPRTGARQLLPGTHWGTGTVAYHALTWSADGSQLGYLDDTTAFVHPLTGGPDVFVGRSLDPDTNHFVWAPDGRTFTQWGADVIEAVTSDNDFTQVTDTAWSPDGRRLAFIGLRQGDLGVYLVDIDTANLHRLTTRVDAGDFGPSRLAWSPDGRWLAYLQVTMPPDLGALHESLVIVDPDAGAPRRLADVGIAMDSHAPRVHPNLTWSADSTAIAVVANYSGVADGWGLYVVTLDGTTHPALVGSIASAAVAWRPIP